MQVSKDFIDFIAVDHLSKYLAIRLSLDAQNMENGARGNCIVNVYLYKIFLLYFGFFSEL